MDNNPDIDAKQAALADDIIWGVEGIAKELDASLTKTRWLIRAKRIPVFKLPGGRQILASRKALRKAFKSVAA
jgi:hypothetical protein